MSYLKDLNNYTTLTDFYELTMANGYYELGMKDQIVYFDMFYRTNPNSAGFAICAGLEQLIDYIENLKFSDSDIAYLNLNFEKEYAYIIDWLEHRLQYLDQYFFNDLPQSGIHAATNDARLSHRYTLSGIRVNPSYKGIVIINGKKYLVK